MLIAFDIAGALKGIAPELMKASPTAAWSTFPPLRLLLAQLTYPARCKDIDTVKGHANDGSD